MNRFQGSAPVAAPAPHGTPWLKTGNDYCTDASDFGATVAQKCPRCDEYLPHWGQPVRDPEGDAMFWKIVHPCGAVLTVFND